MYCHFKLYNWRLELDPKVKGDGCEVSLFASLFKWWDRPLQFCINFVKLLNEFEIFDAFRAPSALLLQYMSFFGFHFKLQGLPYNIQRDRPHNTTIISPISMDGKVVRK